MKGGIYNRLLRVIFLKNFFLRWGIDSSENYFLELIKSNLDPKEKQSPRVLIQMTQDYFCLALFSTAVHKLKPAYLGGLWYQSILSMPRGESWIALKKRLRSIARFLDRKKWSRLYGALGLDTVHDLKNRSNSKAIEIFNSLLTKQDLLDLYLDGVKCGDLIYDTYLRYRVQPTVDLKDYYLCYLIDCTFDAIKASRSIFSENNYQIFLTNYTSYIQHGIPTRVALDMGVEVYSAGNLSQFFKRLSKEDSLHTSAHWMYKEKFRRIPNPEIARREAKSMLEYRFSGGVDKATMYMKSSAFIESGEEVPLGVEGVVFLHDFFDSPHCHRWMLFPDFLDWARYTLQVIEDHKLPIAIKPHPNQLPESRDVVMQLKADFPNVLWLPVTLSNRKIFKSGIKCGISVYGTILHELAFNGIPSLAAGDHPHTAFDISITPQTIDEYRTKLINFRKLEQTKETKKEVLDFYYMHNIYSDEGLDISLEGTGIREIGPNMSSGLGEFLNRYPRFPDLKHG